MERRKRQKILFMIVLVVISTLVLSSIVSGGFSIRLEKDVAMSEIEASGVPTKITFNIYETKGPNYILVATQDFFSGQFAADYEFWKFPPGEDTVRIIVDFTNTDAITKDMELWVEMEFDGVVKGARELLKQEAWAMFAEESVSADTVVTGGVTNEMLADNAVTNEKILNDAVTTEKILDGTITEDDLGFTPGDDGDWTISGNDMYSAVSGNVGIGDTNPSAKLSIRLLTYDTEPNLRLSKLTTSKPIDVWVSTEIEGNRLNSFGTLDPTPLLLNPDSTGNVNIAGGGGNVGIGTISSGYKLDVKSSGYTDGMVVRSSDDDRLFRVRENSDGSGGIFVYDENDTPMSAITASTSYINSVNLGIGTTNPQVKLSLGTDLNPKKLALWDGVDDFYGFGVELGRITIHTMDTEKMTILGNGNVGIGTTTPDAGLHVKGADWPSSFLYLEANTDKDAGIHFREGDTWKYSIYNDASDDTLRIEGGRVTFNQSIYVGSILVHDWATVGALTITGGADLSEQFDIKRAKKDLLPTPGMVVSIDPESPGELMISNKAYDRRVAGIISGAGGVKPGMLMGQKDSEADGGTPVALTGRVYAWADASASAIEPGDLLTTSDVVGHAMKVTDYEKAQGAIIGKAMSSLDKGKGLVLVLVTLQ